MGHWLVSLGLLSAEGFQGDPGAIKPDPCLHGQLRMGIQSQQDDCKCNIVCRKGEEWMQVKGGNTFVATVLQKM